LEDSVKVISVLNFKGGVGKTTLVANLAVDLAQRGYRVLAIDVDPQCSLTLSFISSVDLQKFNGKGLDLKAWFDSIGNHGPLPPLTRNIVNSKNICSIKGYNSLNSLDFIFSNLKLTDIEEKLFEKLYSASNMYSTVHFYLKNALIAIKNSYDVVLLDCAPNFYMLTRNAFFASDCYIVPIKLDALSVIGLPSLSDKIRDISSKLQSLWHWPELLGIVPTMFHKRNGIYENTYQEIINQLVNEYGYGQKIFDNGIQVNDKTFGEALHCSRPVVLSGGSTSVGRERIWELNALATEVIAKARLQHGVKICGSKACS
jgi:chromosome partitioning protein